VQLQARHSKHCKAVPTKDKVVGILMPEKNKFFLKLKPAISMK
jgi:hypothetical protein